MAKILIHLLLSLTLFSCATPRFYQGNEAIDPGIISELEQFTDDAELCESPYPAKVTLNKEFRYGCFCGLGHPSIEYSGGYDSLSLSMEDKMERAKKYYSIKPVDDIDQACRDHDVCWLIHGRNSGECNDAFRGRMLYLESEFGEKAPFQDTESINWRCSILAGDIYAAFITSAVSDEYKEPARTAGRGLAKNLLTPILGPVIVLANVPIWAGDNYPRANDYCIIDDRP